MADEAKISMTAPMLPNKISKLLTGVPSITTEVPPLLITALIGGVNDSPGGSNT